MGRIWQQLRSRLRQISETMPELRRCQESPKPEASTFARSPTSSLSMHFSNASCVSFGLSSSSTKLSADPTRISTRFHPRCERRRRRSCATSGTSSPLPWSGSRRISSAAAWASSRPARFGHSRRHGQIGKEAEYLELHFGITVTRLWTDRRFSRPRLPIRAGSKSGGPIWFFH